MTPDPTTTGPFRQHRDDVAGAAWRARHMPHLAALIDTDRGRDRDRVGVA
jgi:hypothetical protein